MTGWTLRAQSRANRLDARMNGTRHAMTQQRPFCAPVLSTRSAGLALRRRQRTRGPRRDGRRTSCVGPASPYDAAMRGGRRADIGWYATTFVLACAAGAVAAGI